MAAGDVELRIKGVDNASKVVDRINGKLGGLSGVGSKLGNVLKTGLKVGAVAAAAGLVALAGAGVKSVASFAEFEQAIANTGAVSNATQGQLESLSSVAKEMGRTTKFTAKESADAMSFLAMAGFKVEETIGALPGVLQLAAASNLDLASSADITSNVLTGYGMKVEELGRVNDVLVGALTKTNTNLSQLGEAMKYAGPVAKSAGIEFEMAAAAIGLMGNAGIQGTMAGTSLRGAITKLLLPSNQAVEVMERLGIRATDAAGNLMPLDDIVRQLETSGANTADMMAIFGQRAGPAMAALVSQGSDALVDLYDELNATGGLAGEIADKQLDTLQGSLTLLRSAIDGAFIALGEQLAPTIRKVADFLSTTAVPALTAFIEKMGPKLQGAIKDTGSELGPWVKDLMPSLEGLLDSVVTLFGALHDAAEPLIPVFAEIAKTQLKLLIDGLAAIADLIANHPELIYAIVAAWAAWRIASLISQIGTLVTAVRGLNLAFIGPAGLAAGIGLAAIALGGFIDAHRDAIDSMPVVGGLVKGNARFQRELNETMEEAADLYERNLITAEELKQKGIVALGDALATMTEEFEASSSSYLKWTMMGKDATDEIIAGGTNLVKEMQHQKATLSQIYDALGRAGIKWKNTTIEDALKPMQEQYAGTAEGVARDAEKMLNAWTVTVPGLETAASEMGRIQFRLTERSEEDWGRISESIKSVLPTVDQTLEEWRQQLETMFEAQTNFEKNLRVLYDNLAAANVENLSDIVRTIEQEGPMAAQAAVDMLREGTAGLETYRLLGEHITATNRYTGDIVGAIEYEKLTAAQTMADLARAMIGGFNSTLFEETPKAVSAVDYMTGEMKQALTGSPEFVTWHWGIEMAEDLARGLQMGLNQQLPDAERFVGQWAATLCGVYEVGGAEAAKAWTRALYKQLMEAGEWGATGGIAQNLQNLLAIKEPVVLPELPLPDVYRMEQYIANWSHALKEAYAAGGEDAAVTYANKIAEMLPDSWDTIVIPRIQSLFRNLGITSWDAAVGAGEEGGEGLTSGLADKVDKLTPATSLSIADSLRLGLASFSEDAGMWGQGIGTYIMSGIYKAFLDNFAGYAAHIATIIYDELKDALGASSPAKKMIPLGIMAGQGYSMGFEKALGGRVLSAPALSAPVGAPLSASRVAAGGEVHYHFDGPLLGDQRQLEEIADRLEPVLRQRMG